MDTRRAFAAAGMTVAALGTVYAGAAWAPPGDTATSTSTRFGITVDGVEAAVFSRCLGLGNKSEVVAYEFIDRDGTKGTALQPGATKAGSIVCERGVTSSLTLSDWREQVVSGQTAGARKNVTFSLYNDVGAVAAKWNAKNVWPSEITYYFGSGGGREVVTFVSESTTRVAP